MGTLSSKFRECQDTDKIHTAKMGEIDLVNRDPNNINDHIKVEFEDILAEPDSTHSIDCVWKNSYRCFNFCKRFCYLLMTTLCGICIAAEWGCEFAWIAFIHIWHVTPCFKCLEINCGCLQKLYGMGVHCLVDPWCDACALFFGAFKKAS